MIFFLIVCGVLIASAGLFLLFMPNVVLDYLDENKSKPWVHHIAIGVRIVLGTLLLLNASVSNFPVLIEVFGWVSIIAAMGLLAIGKDRFAKLVGWVLKLLQPYARAGGLVTFTFGCFIAYSFL